MDELNLGQLKITVAEKPKLENLLRTAEHEASATCNAVNKLCLLKGKERRPMEEIKHRDSMSM